MTNTVLALPAGQAATVIIKALKKDSSLRVIAADSNFLAPGLQMADKGYLIPPFADPNFYEKLCEIIAKESVDVIYPCYHFLIPTMSHLADKLLKMGVKVIVSGSKTVDICMDKWKMYQHLSKIIPMPKSTIENDVGYILDYIGLPAFIKPRNGSGSKNIHKLCDAEDVRYYVKKVPNPIVQEYIEGEEYSLDILVNEGGRLLCVVAKKVFEFSDGIPIKAAIEPRNELIDLAKKLCRSLKFFGVISVGTLMDKKDMKPKLIEINPRTGISVILSVGAGCNLPLSAVRLALGKPVDPARLVPRSVYMSRYHEEIFLEEPPAGKNIDAKMLSQFD